MRNAFKLFGLCMLAALSMMALVAGTAHATEKKGHFLLEGKTFPEAGVAEEAFSGTASGGDLLTAGGIEVGCTDGSGTGTLLAEVAHAHILFNGCTVLGSGACKVWESLGTLGDLKTLAGEGHILASGLGRPLLHKGKHYLLLEGLKNAGVKSLKGIEEPIFSLFDIYGKFCPLNEGTNPFHVEITGTTVVELPTALTDQKLQSLVTIDPATLKTLFPDDQLFFGSEKAHLSGGITASVTLNSGKLFGAL